MTTTLELAILRMLRRSAEPLSGRRVADILGVAPNTANRALKSMLERALVSSAREGRATLWTTTADVAELVELEASTHERVALVVTAVELEHTEVRNRLLNAERVRVGGIWMVQGEVVGDNIDWTVFLARAGMGNATSAALVGLAARDLKANLVAFVGTAAGLKPGDQRHLDVVVASRIHNPYAGKQVATEFGTQLLGRDQTYVVPAPLVAVVNACIADSEWTSAIRSPHYNARHAHAFVAPIVSVEAVQSDPNGPVLQEILARFQDAAALDMESFGLAAGSDIHDLPVLAVRGISDFIGDKGKAGNDDLQPRAAGHAAGLLRDILVYAHPEDFKRGVQAPTPAHPDSGRAEFTVRALPGSAQIWMDRLERNSPTNASAAREAIAALHGAGVTAATWLNRALHRPPAWLREDDTGDGWALVATLASIAGSTVAWRGFKRAADAAKLTGNLDASSYFTLTSRLAQIANDPDDENAEAADVMDGFDNEIVARFGAVIDFYRAAIAGDLVQAKGYAEFAVAAFGLIDRSEVLRTPAAAVPEIHIDPPLRDLVVATLLRQLAQMMLAPGAADQLGVQSGLATRTLRGNPITRDLADDGLRLAQWALELRPDAEGARLTRAQMMLGVLVSMTGRTSADVEDEISKRARGVEADAMIVRDVLREWDGSSGAALAVAARARSIQGDFVGALRLLLPPPDGLASQEEASHPEVVRLAAFIARAAGEDELALELAQKNPDRVEGELMRAAVLAGKPQMAGEANEALLAALRQSESRHHSNFQALMALSRRYNSLKESEQAMVDKHIDGMDQVDRELADVMRARILLSQGNPKEALRYVRGMERNELALEAHADALVASDRAEEAARLVFEEGLRRGDIPLATEALEIATVNGLVDVAADIALTLMGHDDGKPVRLKALRTLQSVARSANRWHDVATRTEQVMEELETTGLPVPEIEYWRLAEALFFMEKFHKALSVLLDAPAVSFSEREKAQLFLSILHKANEVQRTRRDNTRPVANLGDKRVYSMFMRAASDWVGDEQIATLAMSVVVMAPGSAFNESQIAAFREYSEQYFERHGENASIKQIEVEDDDLDPLIEFLRSGDARQRHLEDLAGEVRAGKYPLAVLTEAAGRSTTESLIRRDLGYVMAIDDDGGLGMQVARDSLGGRAVVDTTAVVVAPWTGHHFRKLAAHFDAVIVPAPLREDIGRARSSLAMRSTTTVGWDTRQQRPTLSETSADEAKAYADAAERVWADVQGLQVAQVPDATRRDRWLSALTVAQELGIPMWADDSALRRFARSMGVAAFSSLDIIRAFASDDEVAAAVTSFRENKVVDMPIDEPWHWLASQAEWRTDSPFALAIARPAAWANIPESFNQFRALISLRPHAMEPGQTATWAHLAGNGLAMATVAMARPRVVSALLAWVIFFADPIFTVARDGQSTLKGDELPEDAGQVTQLIMGVAESLRDNHYEGTDALGPLVDILCGGLLDSIGPDATSRIFAALLGRLEDATASKVFAAYIQSAGR